MLTEQTLLLLDMVSRTGSFTHAASKLHKVPSAISYTIKQLEIELGVILFERHHRSVTLTPAGESFIHQSRKLLVEMDTMRSEAKRVANGWQPTLSITFDSVVQSTKMNDLIEDFYRHFDDVELIIRVEVFNGVWESISTGRSDVAIGATSAIPIGGGFNFIEMGAIEWDFVVSTHHPLAAASLPITDEELRQYPSICIEDTSRDIPKRTTWLLENQRRLVVPDWQSAINCFRKGLGIGYVPSYFSASHIDSGHLVKKPTKTIKKSSPCCMAWNVKNQSPAMKWILNYLGNSAQLHHDWLS